MTPVSAPGELAVELAWSLWRELGVPAPVRRHTDWLVVPEPLILFTAALGDRDRRLRDNALAWCREHLLLISTRALRHTFTAEAWDVGAVADFSAALGEHTPARWPGHEVGTAFTVAAEVPPLATLRAPSQLALRMRALFGVGSRAEILRVLLAEVPHPVTIADLARAAHATKRQTTETVEQLDWSGAVVVDRSRQPFRVRLRQREELSGLLGEPPEVAPSWGPLLRLLTAIASVLEDVESLPDDLAGAELHRLLRTHAGQVSRLGLDPPAPESGASFRRRTTSWCRELLEDVAAGVPDHLGFGLQRRQRAQALPHGEAG
ncbi:MAG: hypothetical protein WD080_00110 [Egibacteraceae bacterium]